MKTLRKTMLWALCLALMLLPCACLAEGGLSFDGTVQAARAVSVPSPIGGTAGQVNWLAGMRIQAGDAVVSLSPTPVYASESGVVTGVFASPGDSVENAQSQFGAVLYVEPECGFTISTTTDKAYDAGENRFIHAGETVYLMGVSNNSHKGAGVIASVSGSSYTVKVTSGEAFSMDESVNIFRSDSYAAKTRIGRGEIARVNPTAYTGTGSVYALHVKNGDPVQAGDLLFETLPGVYDAYYFTGNTALCGVNGIVESVSVQEGASVSKGDTLLRVYPDGALYVDFAISEADILSVKEGDAVELEFSWNEDSGEKTRGEITFISYVSASSTGEASYAARASFTPGENARIGMSCVVYTLEAEAEETKEETPAPEEAPEATPEEAPAQ